MTKYDPDAKPNDDARSGIGVNASGEIIPMEAVISDKDSKKLHRQAEFTEQVVEERRKRSKEPVRMDGLKPLPAELRKSMPGPGVIPGGAGAMDSAPSMQRTKPAPFQRPRISIDHHGKTWSYVRADQVRPGDMVAEFGRVAGVDTHIGRGSVAGVDDVAVGVRVLVTNVGGGHRDFDVADQVMVFRVHDE